MPRTVTLLLTAVVAAVLAGLVPTLEGPAPSSASGTIDHVAAALERRDPAVPDLPFPDNPDPSQCGIPQAWQGKDPQAWLTGVWQDELVQPEVLLYDGHLRLNIKASAAHGAEVEIVLYQSNPVLDYYLVEVVGQEGVSGWVPGPFLSLEPVLG